MQVTEASHILLSCIVPTGVATSAHIIIANAQIIIATEHQLLDRFAQCYVTVLSASWYANPSELW